LLRVARDNVKTSEPLHARETDRGKMGLHSRRECPDSVIHLQTGLNRQRVRNLLSVVQSRTCAVTEYSTAPAASRLSPERSSVQGSRPAIKVDRRICSPYLPISAYQAVGESAGVEPATDGFRDRCSFQSELTF
jgi:hypothetical protein